MKNKIIGIIFAVVLIGLHMYAGYSSLHTLIGCSSATASIEELLRDQGNNIEFAKGNLYACYPEIYEIEHTINYLIPLGTEHYYVAIDKAGEYCLAIKAPEDFDMDNFPDLFNNSGTYITGQVKKLDHDPRSGMVAFLNRYQDIHGTPDYYLDITCKSHAYLGLILFVSAILSTVLIIIAIKSRAQTADNKISALGIATIVCVVVWLICLIKFL